MAYGTIKVDNITFDNGGVDKLITVSGLFYSTSGALTVTGAISGGSVTAPTATFTTLTGTTTAGTTATFTSGSFTSLTGVTTTVTSGIFGLGTAAAPSIAISGAGIYSPGANQLAISTSGTEKLIVKSDGKVGIGTSAPQVKHHVSNGYSAATSLDGSLVQLISSNAATGDFAGLGILGGTTGGSFIHFGDTDNAVIGRIGYFHSDNSFRVHTNGTERVRITNDGSVLMGKGTQDFGATPGFEFYRGTSDAILFMTRLGNPALDINRTNNDGTLVVFRQAGTEEGSISVSGTTISYNGAHLSRWSQLPNGATREEILRGSVLSNIDEMCEWGDEENEQLNRMKVSDIEGDKNVSGVFQAWDDDDDTYTNDFYCAMTGDFIIRIAEGVTVERGDLLMSAGDGTAKPQDDDIIRSKTIAKVTSTNVSCTYEDGSYCVPCVLMAC